MSESALFYVAVVGGIALLTPVSLYWFRERRSGSALNSSSFGIVARGQWGFLFGLRKRAQDDVDLARELHPHQSATGGFCVRPDELRRAEK